MSSSLWKFGVWERANPYKINQKTKVIDRTGDYFFSSFVMSQDVDSGAVIV